MRLYWLVLGVLGVWRVTHLLHAEDGPGDLLVRLRRKAGQGLAGSLLDCFYCLSLWVSAPFAWLLGESLKEAFLLWLAFSAGAILCERTMSRGQERSMGVPYWKEEDINVLREEKNERR